MNTKLLMILSAMVMGAIGITLSFAPQEIIVLLGTDIAISHTLTLQLLGALYFAFAMVNWTARTHLIGGIYSRPIAIGNLTHFVVGALALIKGYFAFPQPAFLVVALIYTVFAVAFTLVFFRHPVKTREI